MPSILEKVTEERCDYHEFQNFLFFKFYNVNIFERSIDRNELEWTEGSEEETIGELSLSKNRSILSINQISWMHVAIVDKTACLSLYDMTEQTFLTITYSDKSNCLAFSTREKGME